MVDPTARFAHAGIAERRDRMSMALGNTAQERVRRRALSDRAFAWILIAPAILFIAVIVASPLVETIRLSLTNASLAGKSHVGFAEDEKLFPGGKFGEIILRPFVWMFIPVRLKLVLGLIRASLLMAVVPGQALFPILIMPPWVIPIAMGTLGWLWRFNGDFGIISGAAQRIASPTDPSPSLPTRPRPSGRPSSPMPGAALRWSRCSSSPRCSGFRATCMRPPGSMAQAVGFVSEGSPFPGSCR